MRGKAVIQEAVFSIADVVRVLPQAVCLFSPHNKRRTKRYLLNKVTLYYGSVEGVGEAYVCDESLCQFDVSR